MYQIWKQLLSVKKLGRPRAEFRTELLARLKTDPAWSSRRKSALDRTRVYTRYSSVSSLRWATAFAVVVIVLTTGGAYVYASPSVDADHPLYAVKRSIESLGYKLQRTPVARARFQKKLVERRLKEVERSRRDAPRAAANQELQQFVKEIKSLPREERKEAIREIKERVRERKLEVQTELFKESEKEFEVPPAVVKPVEPKAPLPVVEPEKESTTVKPNF